VPQDYAFALKVNGEYHGQKLHGTGKSVACWRCVTPTSHSRCKRK
jgi:hypothetical protein